MRYVFGDLELDAEAYELRRNGVPVKLQPKVFQLIAYLVEHRERLVDKSELSSVLWPSEHVTESSLFVCVRAARAALGQTRSQTLPIATVRGRGYRFVAPTRVVSRSTAPSALASSDLTAAIGGEADPFVGRSDVMQTLKRSLAQAIELDGRVLLLTGEPGIGKTRCVEELVTVARDRGLRPWLGRALEESGAPAFWPWIQLVRQAVDEGPSAFRDEGNALLALLTPQSRGGDSAATQAGETADRFWLLDRFARFLKSTAQAEARLFVLDDLQWADDASLRLLHIFAAELRGLACLVVGTLREPRARSDGPAEAHLRKLTRVATVVPLRGLSQSESESLVASFVGKAGPAALGGKLHERAEGNPLFLREILRMLMQDGPSGMSDERWQAFELPPAVRDVVSGRIDELPEDARTLLGAASVLGREFDLPLLQRLVDQHPDASLVALDAAVQAKLLAATQKSHRFTFLHDVVREVVYDQLTPAERLRYHRRAGEALEAQPPSEVSPSVIAHHFYRALADGQEDKVLRYSRSAAEAAMRMFAFADSARFYEWAIEALSFQRSENLRVRAELSIALGAARLALGDVDGSRKILKSAIEVGESLDQADLLIVAGSLLRPVSAMAPVPDALALRAFERARALLDPSQARQLVSVLSHLACMPPSSLDLERSKALSAQALELAKTTGSRSCRIEALDAKMYSLTGPDDIDELLATATELLELQHKPSNSWSFGQAHFYRYHALLYRGDKQAADAALEDFGRAVHRMPFPEPVCMYDRICAQRDFHEGKIDEAQAAYAEQLARGKRLGMGYADLFYAIQMIVVLRERQGLAQLTEPPSFESVGFWDVTSVSAFVTANVSGLIEAGRIQDAKQSFAKLAARDFVDLPKNLDYLFALAHLAQAAVALEDRPRAQALYALLLPYARYNTPNALSFCNGSVSHFLGLLAAFLKDPKAATEHFELALSENSRLHYPAQLARTQCEYARFLMHANSRQHRERAGELLLQAQRTAQSLGLAPIAQAVSRLQAALPAIASA